MSQINQSPNDNNKRSSNSDNHDGSTDASIISPGKEKLENIPKVKPLDSTAVWEFLKPRIIASTVVGSIGGATAGYYIGDKTAIYFYKYGFSTGLLGASFFTSSYTIRHFRGKEDILNDAASGALTLGVLNLSSGGYRGGLQGAAFGMLLGSVYWLSSHWVYEAARATWVQNRRFTLQYSTDKTPKERRPKIDRSELFLRRKQQEEAEGSGNNKKNNIGFSITFGKAGEMDSYSRFKRFQEKFLGPKSSNPATSSDGSESKEDGGGPEKKT
jgi:hypothetical protein